MAGIVCRWGDSVYCTGDGAYALSNQGTVLVVTLRRLMVTLRSILLPFFWCNFDNFLYPS